MDRIDQMQRQLRDAAILGRKPIRWEMSEAGYRQLAGQVEPGMKADPHNAEKLEALGLPIVITDRPGVDCELIAGDIGSDKD